MLIFKQFPSRFGPTAAKIRLRHHDFVRGDLHGWLRVAVVERRSLTIILFAWHSGRMVERRSLTGELSLSCARPAADW